MDEPLQELENELKSLQPRRAAAPWLERISRDLAAELPAPARPRDAAVTNLRQGPWFGWRVAGMAAAAALAIALGVVGYKSRTLPTAGESGIAATDPVKAGPEVAATADVYQPIAATNVLYELKDEGPVQRGGETVRQIRARYVDTYTWKNPRNNASLKWSVPRDEIRVLPASYTVN